MTQDNPSSMTVGVWADVVCPWCRLGHAYLEQALSDFDHSDEVAVVWRSFELDPAAPRQQDGTLTDHLVAKLGRDRQEIHELNGMIVARGCEVGVDFRFDDAQPGNTFDAHRLLHLAADRGLASELMNRLYSAYFTEGLAIGDPSTMEALAIEVGLDADEVRAVLASDQYADRVRRDEAEARDLQVSGVPFFVFDRRLAAAGAQPAEVLLAGLQQAWDSRPPAP